MNRSGVSIKEIVEYGLDNIEVDKTVTVSLRDLVYIHKVLQEYMRFFHQPMHCQKIADIISFLGDRSSGGAFEVLHTALHKKSDNMLPAEIQKMFDNEELTHPDKPYYYYQKD